ncbi:DUF5123 domain-containing protein [Flavobacterium flavigenum]|uniref:DUF5123 domain-containing protein n=1 Tax=Flavobacterium flavigenum TaxID=3003258 RepID=UPI0022ABD7BF|nr:DUF5123 domain-containing protein [Flavobacterium flavigenum]
MKRKYIIKSLVAALLVVGLAVSCDSYNDAVLDGVGNTRVFSPVGVTAKVRNQTSVELNWTANAQADHYVIEFSADDPNFTTIFKTVEVTSAQLPVTVALEGETLYSIRVKAVSEGNLEESKWTVTTANTLSEQLFLPVQDTDIAAKTAILRWVANSNVTKIVLTPGDITHTITAEEKVAGIATITGLSPEINYQADLFNGTKKRGAITFTTGIDIGDGILVRKGDDLLVAIANADSGAKLFLEPGEYKSVGADGTTPSTDITLNKSITISGVPGLQKPVLHYKITANAGTNNISLVNLILDGTGLENASVVTVASSTASNFGDILISGCEIHDFTRAILNAGSAGGSKIASFTAENCTVTNVSTNNGVEFINVRTAYVASVVLKNSTFNNCSVTRDFIRMDAVTTITGLTSNVLVESCTINAPGMTVANRFMYVRFASNVCTVKNTLFSNTAAIYSSNQVGTTLPVFSNNNYFNSPNFKDTTIASNKVDASGTTLDPGFANVAAGNFTISNQTLIDNKVGDPRWIK